MKFGLTNHLSICFLSHEELVCRITTDLKIGLEDPISSRTIYRELHRLDIYRRVSNHKPFITNMNTKKMHQNWDLDN